MALFTLSMLAASLVAFMPGCGPSSEDQAMMYIGRDDAYAYRMASEGEKISAALEGFFDVLQGLNPEATLNPGGSLEQYEDTQGDMLSNVIPAEGEYQGVLSLDSVEEEKEYTTTMIEIAQKTGNPGEFVDEWFGKALDVIETLNESKIRSYLTGGEFEDGLAEIDKMRVETDALAGEARDYRLQRDF